MVSTRNIQQIHTIHPNAPKRLLEELSKCGWIERELARRKGINISYVSQLIHYGIEPTDKTEKGQEARAALFLPKKKPKQKEEKKKPDAPSPEWWQHVEKHAIDFMVRQIKKSIKNYFEKDKEA